MNAVFSKKLSYCLWLSFCVLLGFSKHNANAQADSYTYDYLANSSSLVAKITGTLMKTENVYETTRNLRTDVKNYAYIAWQQSGFFHLKNHDQYDYNAIGQRARSIDVVERTTAIQRLHKHGLSFRESYMVKETKNRL